MPAASAAKAQIRPKISPLSSRKIRKYRHVLPFRGISLFCAAVKATSPSGHAAMGATCRAPFQERATTSVTTSGAEAGTIEAIETSQPSTPATDVAPTGFDGLGLDAQILKA